MNLSTSFKIYHIFLLIFFLCVIFLSTYGTANQGIDFSGTIYSLYGLTAWMVFSAIVIVFGLFTKNRTRRNYLANHDLQLFLVILMILLISTINYPEKVFTVSFVVVLSVLPIYLILTNVRSEFDFLTWYTFYHLTIFTTCWLALIVGIYTLTGNSIYISPFVIEYNFNFWRMNSWFNNSTMLGLFFFHGLISAYYFFFKYPNWKVKLLTSLSAISFIVGIGLAGGRTGVIVTLVSFFALLVTKLSTSFIRFQLLGILSILAFLLGFYFLSIYGESIYILRRLSADEIYELGGRIAYFQDSWKALSEAPFLNVLFGYGISGTYDKLNWPFGAHSGVMRILLENGVVTLSLLIILQFSIFLRLAYYTRNALIHRLEISTLYLSWLGYCLAEIMVIQLLGVSLLHLLFVVTFTFVIIAFNSNYEINSQLVEKYGRDNN